MTILFRKDWLKHPRAIIHYSTKNKSFLRLAQIYHSLGVKNCAFHLALHNPDLEHLDPFDVDNLTPTQMQAILYECMTNFWYYIREIMRVDSSASIFGSPFKGNRSNIATYWLYFNHITVMNTVIRQTGKTTSLKGVYNYLLNFGLSGSTIGLVTKDMTLKSETMESIKDQFGYLPDYLNMSNHRDIMNSDEVSVKATGNTLRCWLSSTSKVGAVKVARGFSLGTIGWDEIAYIPNIELAMSSASFSANAAVPQLKEAGLPYGTLMFTTAGDKENKDGKFVYQMINNSTLFTEKMFDCEDIDELTDLIYTNSLARNKEDRNPMVVVSMSYRQMGFSDQWMKEALERNKNVGKTALNRDLYNRWVSASSESPLYEDEIERLEAGEVDDPRIELFEPFNYLLRWYVSEEELATRKAMGHSIIIGIDTSEGSGRDDNAFYGRDSVTGETLVTGVFNEINTLTMSKFFVEFLMRHENAVQVIERKNTGPGILDNMIVFLCAKGINPFTRLYNDVYQDPQRFEKEFEILSKAHASRVEIFTKFKKYLGFTTTGSGPTSRDMLFSTVLRNKLKFTAHTCRDKITINQFMGLVYRNGRVDHAEGGHDDMVVASLLSYWFLMNGKNLQMYGVNPRSVLKKNDVYLNEKFEISDSKHEHEAMAEVEREINILVEKLKGENNPFIIEKHERRITFLYKYVKRDANYISVTDLLESIKKEKRQRLRRAA